MPCAVQLDGVAHLDRECVERDAMHVDPAEPRPLLLHVTQFARHPDFFLSERKLERHATAGLDALRGSETQSCGIQVGCHRRDEYR